MDFTDAMAAATTEERDRLIREEVEGESWDLQEWTYHGGCSTDEEATSTVITHNPDGTVTLVVIVEGIESVSSDCKDYNYEHEMRGTFKYLIEKDGSFTEIDSDVDVSSINGFDGDEDEADGLAYYPFDYN